MSIISCALLKLNTWLYQSSRLQMERSLNWRRFSNDPQLNESYICVQEHAADFTAEG